jgi:hypothetical protein
METIQTTINSKAGSLLQWAVNRTLEKNWYSDSLGQVYLFKITHLKGRDKAVNDVFYKIGYSSMPHLESRIVYLPQCFRVEVLGSVIMEKHKALYTEQAIHKYFRDYKYRPKHSKWSGADECYKLNLMDDYSNLNCIIDSIPDMIKAEADNKANALHSI